MSNNTEDRQKALDNFIKYQLQSGFDFKTIAEIISALEAPLFTDNEYDWLEEFCAQVSSSTNDVEEQEAAIKIGSKIRDRK